MGRGIITACTLSILLAMAPVAGARMNPVMLGGGVVASGGAFSCSATGDILEESFDANPGADNSWTNGTIDPGCIADTDYQAPSVLGFNSESLRIYIDSDAYSESSVKWEDSSARSAVYFRAYITVLSTALAEGEQYTILQYANAALTESISFHIKNDATYGLVLRVSSSGGLSTDEIEIAEDTSYLVEFYANNNGTSDSFDWKVNGISQGSQSGAILDDDFQAIIAGIYLDVWYAAAIDLAFDNIGVSASGWLGSCGE